MAKAKSSGVRLTVPTDTIYEAIVSKVATDFDMSEDRISIERVVRKKGGGIEADVTIAPKTAG